MADCFILRHAYMKKGLGVLFRFDMLSVSLLALWSIVPGVRSTFLEHCLLKWLSSVLVPSGAALRGGSLTLC